jgi:3D (Asp-Asp-Asp) domain-containing protein
MTLEIETVRRFLQSHGIREQNLGGTFVFKDGRFIRDLEKARFFIIHDTSSPEITASEFPANMNEASWPSNRLTSWVNSTVPTHVFVNRVGESATKTNFVQGVLATKYERGLDMPAGAARNRARRERAGLFVNIELIQPRRKSRGSGFFDLAPVPGMTQSQLDRLALLYVVASVRAGRWLIPAFHCAVDTPLPNAHDDPQNFDMNVWLASLRSLLTELPVTTPLSLTSELNAGNMGMQGTANSTGSFDEGEFDLPEPTDATRGRRLNLFATFYFVLSAQNIDTGQPLQAMNGQSLGVKLSERDWCHAAMEGTVLALNGTAPIQTFNFAGRGRDLQVNCRRFFPSVPQPTINALGRSRFEVAGGPFGTGVQSMILVPYRTIAVDSAQRPIPFGTVIFIPQARGKEITLPSGRVVRHDGYFFAADTGGLIKGNHIDVFSGLNPRNPFPEFIKSVETQTFTAFIINDPVIAERLRRAHRRRP